MSKITKKELYGADAREWLRRWDAGDSCWSIEMGGLGPGYEQVIQVLVAEIIRDNLDKPIPKAGEKFSGWGDETVARIDYKKPDGTYAMGGFSGAQVGAAKNLAWNLLTNGPAKVMTDKRVKDRHIQVGKFFPVVAQLTQA